MNNFLTITDNAANQIKKIISNAPNDITGIVIDVDKSGCSGYSYKIEYALKENSKNCDLVEDKGVKVYIDPKASMFLIGSKLDYFQDKISSRFIFDNPNAKNTCGCGESFNL